MHFERSVTVKFTSCFDDKTFTLLKLHTFYKPAEVLHDQMVEVLVENVTTTSLGSNSTLEETTHRSHVDVVTRFRSGSGCSVLFKLKFSTTNRNRFFLKK